MRSYRTSSLFHYTDRIEVIQEILRDGIKPNYAKESFLKGKLIVGVPMISFCDIPLSMTKEIKSYGEYCVGFSKDWGEKENANPVLYYNNFDDEYKMTHELHGRLKSVYEENKDKPKEGNILESIFGNFANYHQIYEIYRYIFGFSKPLKGNNGVHNNYEENEWRIVLTENSNENGSSVKWHWTKCDYCIWRGDGLKPASKFEARKFDITDISFIVVKNESEIQGMINFINKLDQFGGNNNGISSDGKALLLTKLTSFERIEQDY